MEVVLVADIVVVLVVDVVEVVEDVVDGVEFEDDFDSVVVVLVEVDVGLNDDDELHGLQ